MRSACSRTAMYSLALALLCTALHVQASNAAGVDQSPARAGHAPEWTHVRRLLGRWEDATDVALLDDPELIVLGDALGRVTVWNMKHGAQHAALPVQGDAVSAVETDGAGRLIAVGARDRVTVWDTATARQTHEFTAYRVRPNSLSMSRDGSVLAAKTSRLGVTVWNLATGDVIRVISTAKTDARSVSLDADGTRLAIGWANGTAEVHDVRTGEKLLEAMGHTKPVGSVHLTPDGSRLATGSSDFRAKVWDVATGAVVGVYGTRYRVALLSVRISNDGTRVFTLPIGGAVRMWNVATGSRVREYKRDRLRVRHLTLSPDGRRLAGVGRGFALWATGSGESVPVASTRWRRAPSNIQLSVDGLRVLAFYQRRFATVHDSDTGSELQAYGDAETANADGVLTKESTAGPTPALLGVRLLGGGRQVLYFTNDGIVVRGVASDAVARTFEDGPATREPYVLSPDHSLLLTGGVDGSVHIWDVAAGRLMHTLTGHEEDVLSASFDAENSTVVTSDWGSGIRVWNPITGAPLAVLPSTAAGAHAVNVSPNGRYLLVWRGSQHVGDGNRPDPPKSHLWNLETLTEVSPSAAEWVRGAAWGADSETLYTLGMEKAQPTVKVWSPTTFGRLPEMPTPGAWVRTTSYNAFQTPAEIAAMPRPVTRNGPGPRVAASAMQGISRLALSGDGSTFAYINPLGSIDIWRLR